MVKLIRQGVYLMEGRLVKESQAFMTTDKKAEAVKGTIAYSILKAHNCGTEDALRLRFDALAHRPTVDLTVDLRARRAHGGPLGAVEDAELDARLVRHLPHRAAERVHFFDEVALADAADRRIAGELPDRIEIVRDEQRAASHARRGQSGFGSGMAAADHDDVKSFRKNHKNSFVGSVRERPSARKLAARKARPKAYVICRCRTC